MLRRRSIAVVSALAFVSVFILTGQSAQADWSISFSGEHSSSDYRYQLGGRITSDYRRGYQVDDWVERGGSSVTESPIFSDGIRLTSWETRYEDDYDYALASAIYFFELPSRARSVKIKISYDGEATRSAFNEDIAGRVWIRRARIGDDYEEYYPKEGRYQDVDEPLYGDTFILRSKKNYEIIRLSADDYNIDGAMELHVVAEGTQRIDVKYIEVETYASSYNYRVITRYYRDYEWKHWYNYTYWYFYTGPEFRFGDYYYVRYTYPRYRSHYVDIRKRYNSYLRVYYVKRPERHVRWSHVAHIHSGTRRTWDKNRLSRWTAGHDEARRSYKITSRKQRRPVEVQQSRTRIRSVISSQRSLSPATTRSRSNVNVKSSRTNRQVPTSSSVRTRSSTSSSANRSTSSGRSPARVETRSSTKTRREEVQSPARTRSSSSSQSSSNVKRSSSRGSNQESNSTKVKRESSSSRSSSTRSSSSNVRRAPSRKEPQKQSSPKKVEPKKDDDDDDDEDEKKTRSTRSSTSSSGSSSRKTKRTNTR